MGNVFKTPAKVSMKATLFRVGIETLRQQGWKVERIPGFGKSSVRLITKGSHSRKVSIRTSQDKWIAFPRNEADNGWGTLPDVDLVVAVSVDSHHHPRFAQVHMIEGDEMRQRFDRAYKARKAAGYHSPAGRGFWLPLYHSDDNGPVRYVGGGAGIDHPAIRRVALGPGEPAPGPVDAPDNVASDDKSLTIAEAKRRLALSLGVDPSNVKITVEG
jgi:hypothetical protein